MHSPFLDVWRNLLTDITLTQDPAAGREIGAPEAMPNSGRGGPQTSAVRLESQAQLLSPECVICPGGLLSSALVGDDLISSGTAATAGTTHKGSCLLSFQSEKSVAASSLLSTQKVTLRKLALNL